MLLVLTLVLWIVAEAWIHETGHALMARLVGFRVKSVVWAHCQITGPRQAPFRWMLVSLAGPATDLALCLVLALLWNHWYFQVGALVAAVSMVGNMTPWRGSDGFQFLAQTRSVFHRAAY